MKNLKDNGSGLLKTQIDRKEHTRRKSTMGAAKKKEIVRILSGCLGRPNYDAIVHGIAVSMGKNLAQYAEILRIGKSLK